MITCYRYSTRSTILLEEERKRERERRGEIDGQCVYRPLETCSLSSFLPRITLSLFSLALSAEKKKGNGDTRGEQRAGKQAEQSLARPTKKLTPEKLTHQCATKDEREIKQRCAPSAPPPVRSPAGHPPPTRSIATLSLSENKKRMKNLLKK